ncbi:hypothetical protein HZS_6388 [Henneguya salminicola]|nr:hypothetical protein HZS_6388 [Henneguya salminicola]
MGVSFKTFILILALFKPISKKKSPLNTKEQKLKCISVLFNLYDNTNQGYITRDNVYSILNILINDSMEIEKDNLEFIVDHVFNDGDANQDGKISFPEFIKLLEYSDAEIKLSIASLK